MLLALDAHRHHPQSFTGAEFRPYRRHATVAESQRYAICRHNVMRTARSTKNVRTYCEISKNATPLQFGIEAGD